MSWWRGVRANIVLAPGLPALLLAALLLGSPYLYAWGLRGYEDITYFVAPSAERAFSYGEIHFNARHPGTYDIERAERFFTLAAAEDPTLPNVYHELARISFLRGDFNRAMAQIDFQISLQGDKVPSSYYIRGLIEGYMKDYAASARDYEHFLRFYPENWAAINDYGWVLLKAGRSREAIHVLARGLEFFPNNPWLLNSYAIALYEEGDAEGARITSEAATIAVQKLTKPEWLYAYPGNDPRIGAEGLSTFQKAVLDNMHTLDAEVALSAIQSR